MNENSSSNSSTSAAHHGLTAEAISRRAYELWEQEGRPENRDLHHWLRAEQQLLAEMQTGAQGQQDPTARSSNTDQPLQRTPASTVSAAGRDTKAPPKRNGAGDTKQPATRSTQPGMRTAGRS